MTGFLPRLELRQSQTLIMTPQLQQSIKVLQLSNLELTDFIDVEIQQNPLLEWRERGIRESTGGRCRRWRECAPNDCTGDAHGRIHTRRGRPLATGVGRGW